MIRARLFGRAWDSFLGPRSVYATVSESSAETTHSLLIILCTVRESSALGSKLHAEQLVPSSGFQRSFSDINDELNEMSDHLGKQPLSVGSTKRDGFSIQGFVQCCFQVTLQGFHAHATL